jgi:hypothetical protein
MSDSEDDSQQAQTQVAGEEKKAEPGKIFYRG